MDELSGTRRTAAIISSNQPEAICHVSTHNAFAVHVPIVAGISAIRGRSVDRARVSRPLRRMALAQGAAHGPRAVLPLPDRQHLARGIRKEHRGQLGTGVLANVVVFSAGTGRRMAVGFDSYHPNGLAKFAYIDAALLEIGLAADLAGRVKLRRAGTVRVPPADLRALASDFACSCHSGRMVA